MDRKINILENWFLNIKYSPIGPSQSKTLYNLARCIIWKKVEKYDTYKNFVDQVDNLLFWRIRYSPPSPLNLNI